MDENRQVMYLSRHLFALQVDRESGGVFMEPKANMVKAGTRGKGGEKGQKGSSGALKGKVICITGLNSDRKVRLTLWP